MSVTMYDISFEIERLPFASSLTNIHSPGCEDAVNILKSHISCTKNPVVKKLHISGGVAEVRSAIDLKISQAISIIQLYSAMDGDCTISFRAKQEEIPSRINTSSLNR
jgi:hypothetical protein